MTLALFLCRPAAYHVARWSPTAGRATKVCLSLGRCGCPSSADPAQKGTNA